MRKIKFETNEYYHIYNRGNNKRDMFFNEHDYIRFLFLILVFQAPITAHNINRDVNYFLKHKKFNLTPQRKNEILKRRNIELTSFTLMPNHFHLIVNERNGTGIASYMQRLQNSYTKYCNTKHNFSGHLLQGPFQAVHITTNDQLLYLSAYIHKNQRELNEWKNKEHLYTWSSYYDYTIENRWGELLARNIIIDQFKNPKKYQDFVKNSAAKEKNDSTLFID